MVRALVTEECGQGPGGASICGKEAPFHFSLGADGRSVVTLVMGAVSQGITAGAGEGPSLSGVSVQV